MAIIIPNAEAIIPNSVYREPLSKRKNVVYSIFRYSVPSIEDTVNYLRDLLERKKEGVWELEPDDDENEGFDENEACLLEILDTLPRDHQDLFLAGADSIGENFPDDVGEPGSSYLDINGGSLKLGDVRLLLGNRDYLSLDDVEDLLIQYGKNLWNIRFRLDGNRIKLTDKEFDLASQCDCRDLIIDNEDRNYNILVERARRIYYALRDDVSLAVDISSEIEHSCRLKTANSFLENLSLGNRDDDKKRNVRSYSSVIFPN